MFETEFAAHIQVARRSARVLGPPLEAIARNLAEVFQSGGKLLVFGNGGSAADAQHLASELVTGFGATGPAFAALALSTDASALTAAGNDVGFEWIFAQQIKALGRPGDAVLGLSTSGRSRNIVRAFEVARSMGLRTFGWTGGGRHDLCPVCDLVVAVPSVITPRIQEMHGLLGHILCAMILQDAAGT